MIDGSLIKIKIVYKFEDNYDGINFIWDMLTFLLLTTN